MYNIGKGHKTKVIECDPVHLLDIDKFQKAVHFRSTCTVKRYSRSYKEKENTRVEAMATIMLNSTGHMPHRHIRHMVEAQLLKLA